MALNLHGDGSLFAIRRNLTHTVNVKSGPISKAMVSVLVLVLSIGVVSMHQLQGTSHSSSDTHMATSFVMAMHSGSQAHENVSYTKTQSNPAVEGNSCDTDSTHCLWTQQTPVTVVPNSQANFRVHFDPNALGLKSASNTRGAYVLDLNSLSISRT